MRFGEAIDDDRMIALLRPDERIRTVVTADVYGSGEADSLLGGALEGVPRDAYCLVGAIGHDFYAGEREGAKGFPRFTDPRLRREDEYGAYIRMATERSLQRCGADHFDLLLLHNPDRRGYTSAAVWEGMQAVRETGLALELGVAPGPANGFTLDLIECLERFGDSIDWAMIILNPMEPWPGELVLPAARSQGVKLITRVVDYGGLFHDDVLPGHAFAEHDHRTFRPEGWVEAGNRRVAAYTSARRPRTSRGSRSSFSVASSTRSTRRKMFGRSKPATRICGSCSPSSAVISSRTSGVAVAVNAAIGGRPLPRSLRRHERAASHRRR